MIYEDITKEYEEFKQNSLNMFEEKFQEKFIYQDLIYKPHNQMFESNITKKAKLMIFEKYKAKHGFLFNEISARKAKAHGAPTIDLYDIDRRLGIELHWKTRKLTHSVMIPRILRYKKIFGDAILVLLSYGEGNAWKRKQGITYLQESTLKNYIDNGIKIVFFNIDEPKYDWIE